MAKHSRKSGRRLQQHESKFHPQAEDSSWIQCRKAAAGYNCDICLLCVSFGSIEAGQKHVKTQVPPQLSFTVRQLFFHIFTFVAECSNEETRKNFSNLNTCKQLQESLSCKIQLRLKMLLSSSDFSSLPHYCHKQRGAALTYSAV